MCNQLQSVTLQTAVLIQAKEFAQNNQPFSVHDITREIRSKVNNGILEIPEVEVSGASFRFDIPHAKVKALFDELWRTGVFDPDFTLSRNFNGMFYQYTPSPVANVAVPYVPATPVTTPQANFGNAVAQATPSTNAPTTDKTSVTARIEKYLTNCQNKNFRPTLKQVQSAIKRGNESTGWSCDAIKDIITNDLGYDVVDNPDSLSAAQVVI